MTFEQQFFNEYRMMYRPFINRLNIQLEAYGLYSSQWAFLRLLNDEGPLSFGEVANKMYIEKPSVTKLIKKLEEMQLVEIQQGKDKREKLVALTQEGQTIILAIQEELKPVLEQALAGVSEQEIEIAKHVLAEIRKNLMNG